MHTERETSPEQRAANLAEYKFLLGDPKLPLAVRNRQFQLVASMYTSGRITSAELQQLKPLLGADYRRATLTLAEEELARSFSAAIARVSHAVLNLFSSQDRRS